MVWADLLIHAHLHFSSTTIFLLHPGCAANAVMPRAGFDPLSHFSHSAYRWQVWRSLQYRSVLPMMVPVQSGSVWGRVMVSPSPSQQLRGRWLVGWRRIGTAPRLVTRGTASGALQWDDPPPKHLRSGL